MVMKLGEITRKVSTRGIHTSEVDRKLISVHQMLILLVRNIVYNDIVCLKNITSSNLG